VEIADIDNRGKISLILVAEEDSAEAPTDAPNGEAGSTEDAGALPADAATANS
jgi:polyribonucleotide nucleotidyltransferase